MKSLFVVVVCAALLLLTSLRDINAQTTNSGGITGVVTDSSGAVVPSANVELKDTAKGTTHTGVTDGEGRYVFPFLRPGRYTLTVAKKGFATTSRLLDVVLGPTATLNIMLPIMAGRMSVTVTSERPLLQADNGDVATTIGARGVSELPNPGNDLTYVAQTAPGIMMDTDQQGGNNFSSLGMPGTSTVFTINGMNDNDNGYESNNVGSLNLLLGQNQVQEATVVSLDYSGQFGGSAGGYVNYITKSGSNELHGNAQYYWNGRVLNANSWINNATGVKRPFDNANQWAASLGGPIETDKLFFFMDTEGVRVLLPQSYLNTVPSPQFEAATIANIDKRFGAISPSDAFYKRIFALYNTAPGVGSAHPGGWSPNADPTGCTGFSRLGPGVPCALHYAVDLGDPSTDALTSGRLDWNIRTTDRAFFQLQYDGGHITFLDPISPVFNAYHQQPWWMGQLSETHTFSSSAASQFLLAANFIGWWNRLANPSQALAAFPISLNFTAVGTFDSLAPFNSWGAVNGGRPTTQVQISEDVFKTAGNHRLGFGGTLQRIYWTNHSYTPFLEGSLVPQTLDAFYQGGVDPASPNVDATQLTQSFSSRTSERILFLSLGLYAQDEWHARSNLTLTVALRGEHDGNPVCNDHCFVRLAESFASASHDPAQPYNQALLTGERQALRAVDAILWSPRISFAWQPFGVAHNSVLRGGVGIFYDPLPGNIADWLSRNPPQLNVYTVLGDNLTPNESSNLFNDAADSNAAFVNGFNAGETLAQIQAQISKFNPLGFIPPALTTPAGTFHEPQYQRWSLEWQQAFGTHTSVKVLYTGHHGIHEFVLDPNANAWGFGSLPVGVCTSPPVSPCADPRFGRVTNIASAAVSNYNGMVLSFLRHWGGGLLQANYTYGHAFDEVSNGGQGTFTSTSLLASQDPHDLRGAYGPADYDVRHSFNAGYVWELPLRQVFRSHGWNSLVTGWQVAGTIFWHSGFPYTAIDIATSVNLAAKNYFGLIYAVPLGSIPSRVGCGESAANPSEVHPCLPSEVLPNGSPNPNAIFVQAGCETGFNSGSLPSPSGPCSGPTISLAQGRNRFRGPGYFNTDLTLMKHAKLPYRGTTLGFGLEFYNLLNHPNFGLPNTDISNPTFGQIFYQAQPVTTILGSGRGGDASARMIRIKAELRF